MARLAPAALALGALPAFATDGYFPHGYGLKGEAMGGASTALAQDAMGGATNPASMVFSGSRLDLGLDLGLSARHSIGLAYSGEKGSQAQNHALIAQWQMAF